jgi:phosphoribosyl-ATP pyrophosphohydrolase
MGGQAVQLIGGRELALEAGDPLPIAERFSVAGEIAVVDLDAALGQGENAEVIRRLLKAARCRVGGGIRDVDTALRWLDEGASKVVIGTAATPEVLSKLPPERVIAALDAHQGEVVVKGWREGTGRTVLERIRELSGLVGGFLVTFVEREGRMQGLPLDTAREIVEAAGEAKVTIAGGVTTTLDIAALDRMGADAQVGMALYTGAMDLADAIAAPLTTDRPDGLWPTVVVDEHGTALGLAYSSLESLRDAVRTRTGVYHSRKRGLWVKGATTGNTQELLRVDVDCDRDTVRFVVRQQGPFCHTGERTCWGPDWGLRALEATIRSRLADAPEGSYTRRLLDDPSLLDAKLREEAGELASAETPDEVAEEAADLLYFWLVALVRSGKSLEDVERVLDRRALRVTRRGGERKDADA